MGLCQYLCITDADVTNRCQEKSRHEPSREWSQDFWLLPIFGDELDEDEYQRLGGYYFDSQEQFLAERWGVTDIIRETNSTLPVVEGFAWPTGCPYHREPAKKMVDEYEKLEAEENAGSENVTLAASLVGNVSLTS